MVRLPKLNRRNGWPIAMFQTLLIAHARSGLREQQLVMSHLFQFFGDGGLVLEMLLRKLATGFPNFSYYFWLMHLP